MAALRLRDVYDCAVIGDGWAAALVERVMLRAGLKTVLVASESPRAVDAWRHPRLQQTRLQGLPRRKSVRGIIVYDRAGEIVDVVKPNLLKRAGRRTTSHQIGSRPRMASTAINYGEPARARCVVRLVSRPSSRTAVGGIYRQVANEPGDEQFGHLFPTRLSGVVAWLVSCGNGLCSLGMLRTGRDDSLWNLAAPAELFEEALVACPALTRRLVQAQLVGDLHWQGAQPVDEPSPSNETIVLPAYDTEVDPLFASGYELTVRSAQELAAVLVRQRPGSGSLPQQVTEWHTHWRETEQSVRNSVQYHYFCPPARDRRPAGTVLMQPQSSPDFA